MCLQDTDATPVTKSHNSCKTCSIAKSYSYGHLHVMLVTVYGYEQNPSSGVGVGVPIRCFPYMLYISFLKQSPITHVNLQHRKIPSLRSSPWQTKGSTHRHFNGRTYGEVIFRNTKPSMFLNACFSTPSVQPLAHISDNHALKQ